MTNIIKSLNWQVFGIIGITLDAHNNLDLISKGIEEYNGNNDAHEKNEGIKHIVVGGLGIGTDIIAGVSIVYPNLLTKGIGAVILFNNNRIITALDFSNMITDVFDGDTADNLL